MANTWSVDYYTDRVVERKPEWPNERALPNFTTEAGAWRYCVTRAEQRVAGAENALKVAKACLAKCRKRLATVEE